jgi:hypothetical protein
MSTWLLDVLGYNSYVLLSVCLLLVDKQVIHLVPNKMKTSKANQCFMSIIHITEATHLKSTHVAIDANDDHYHLFTNILHVKTEVACSDSAGLRLVIPAMLCLTAVSQEFTTTGLTA